MEWKDGIAGAISGVATRCCVAPLDVIKIRLQLQTNCQGSSRDYRGFLGTFQTIVRREGVVALWKGNLAAEFLWGGYMGTQFLAYRSLQNAIHHHTFMHGGGRNNEHASQAQDTRLNDGSKVLRDLICGGLAGGFATMTTYPFDLVRTRLAAQTEPKIYHGVLDAFYRILISERMRGFYRGLAPSLIQVMPYMGIQFSIYEALKRFISTQTKEGSQGWKESMFCGCVAGSISKISTLPLDVTKKRMQVMGTTMLAASQGRKISSMREVVRGILRDEGWQGFFRGGLPSVMKTALSSGLSFAIYELMLKIL
uniref:Mitochondrial carrier protein n=1 Tax=Guillardia theta TaxID=55529 RepID=A0A7S4UK77_GUITH|mmetsp:Transcript_44443/g.140241  ORF Transcript_44443/g.140241 Transcript_44443/m.140241 type:complete len:310 (+) Transcript_44443:162-1091(+)